MAVNIFTLAGKVILNGAGKAQLSLKELDDQGEKTNRGLKKSLSGIGKTAIVGIGAAVAAGVLFTKKMSAIGSDAEEVQNKFDVVFGDMASDAEKWSKDFAKSLGRSQFEVKALLADNQDMLTGFGATTKEASDLSKMFVSLGTDLASFNNLQDADAIERVRKGLLGETENLKSLGIVINETIMKEKALELGYGDNLKQLTELEKIQVRYAIATDQSTNAIGDAARSQGSYASQLKTMKSRIQDTITTIAVGLLPAFTALVTLVIDHVLPTFELFAEWIVANLPMIQEVFGTVFRAIGAAVGTVYGFIRDNLLPIFIDVYKFIADNWDELAEVFTLAFDVVVFAIKLAVAILKVLFEWLLKAYNYIKNVFPEIKSIFLGIFESIEDAIDNTIKKITEFIDKLKAAIEKVKNFFTAAEGSKGEIDAQFGAGASDLIGSDRVKQQLNIQTNASPAQVEDIINAGNRRLALEMGAR